MQRHRLDQLVRFFTHLYPPPITLPSPGEAGGSEESVDRDYHRRVRRLLVATLLACACVGPSSGLPKEEGDSTTGGKETASPECDPLSQDCPPEQACYFVGGDRAFGCETPGETPEGFGGPCQFGIACDVGLTCSSLEVTPGCAEGFGCCTPFCEFGSNDCPPGLECQRIYDSGAPPGYENVGQCEP
jgi:hypothetical protein